MTPSILEKKDSRFLEFIVALEESVRQRRLGDVDVGDEVQSAAPWEEAFTVEVLERLGDGGDLPDLDPAYFEQKVGRRNAKLNAYGISSVDRRADLVVTVHTGETPGESSPNIPAAEVTTAAHKALHAFRSARESRHEKMEESSAAADMFQTLHEHHESISELRVIVLVNGIARKADLEQPEDLPPAKLDVWDHVRLARVCSSGLPYEDVTIDLLDHIEEPLPFVDSGVQAEDHHCLLTIFPGELLYSLYDELGARLLELNVRSFLQARGKVNKGIRKTLKEDPEHFFAFNNGISATVAGIAYGERADGSQGITQLRGLQIVNGGQTTASIHRAKKQDKCDLSRVGVQAKITIVTAEHLESLVPNISRYSNTQNKVNETDFSANHPFHVLLQQLSERVWAPGETTRWFYERARGQWEVARSREGTTPARKKAFDVRTPRKQRIDKALLARSENSWNQKPHIVSRGGQKNFVEFMTSLTDETVDEEAYRRIVARVILYKTAESVAREIGFSAYRANAVTYTIALLAYRTSGRIRFGQIWADQEVSPLIRSVLMEWMPVVHDSITEMAFGQGKNVTEWAKKTECWAAVQNLSVEVPDELMSILREGLSLPNVGAFRDGSVVRQLSELEVRRQERVMAMTAADLAATFRQLSKYFNSHGLPFKSWQAMTGCLTTIQIYAENQWTHIPSPKQTKQVLKALDFIEEREAADGDDEG